ncbi:hypothetical protein LJC45_02670 [Alistipes sp. OttesenSCG-928-B03]|nr:hypothetical protein [Alistipes sp. OttesenSCG-928-B03]
MKKLIFTLCIVALAAACTPTEKLLQVAEDYATQNICSLLPNGVVSEDGTGPTVILDRKDRIRFVKGDTQMLKTHTAMRQQQVDDLVYGVQRINMGDIMTPEESRANAIIKAAHQSAMDAVWAGDREKGFYIAVVYIKYNDGDNNSFEIVISKDMKVLNQPIDIAAIDKAE